MLITRYQLAAWRFASTDESRTSLHCLRLGPEPRTVWATNGHYAVKVEALADVAEADFPAIPGVTWQEAKEGESILLPAEMARAALKALKVEAILQHARISLEAGATEGAPTHIVVAVTDLEKPTVLRARVPDVTFPDVAHIFNEFKPSALNAPISLSGRYLADVGGYAGLVNRRSAAITWEFCGPNKPVRFSWADDEHRVTGILMPIWV